MKKTPKAQIAFISLIFAAVFSASAFAQSATGVPKPRPASSTAGKGVVADALNAADPSKPAVKLKPVRDPALYRGEAVMDTVGDNAKRIATAQALSQVIVKLTGNPAANGNVVIRRAMPTAGSLVAETTTRQDGDTASGMPVYKNVLAVSFDPDAVDALIGAAGLKYWTGAKPRPILWLAIDDGRGPRLVTSQQLSVVRPLAMRGLERGMRFLLPSGNSVEIAATNSVWALNAAALQALTARYQNNTQMIGKVYRSVSGWSAQWVMTQDGVEIARWVDTKADPRQVIASGADGAADAIAKRDAVYLNTGVAGKYQIDVAGVNDSDDFIRLMGYLQQLAIVRRVQVIQATPESLRLELDMNAGMKSFYTLIGSGGILRSTDHDADNTSDSSDETAAQPETKSVPRFILQ
ncbi:MAG: DUF2066 domain-containing protein [Arenimonas sp.]